MARLQNNIKNTKFEVGMDGVHGQIRDSFRSISSPARGLFKDNGSRFIACAYPVETEAEVKEIVDSLKKEYHDARHHCYAYRLGYRGDRFRANDDGEPSGSAGRPILGQIDSRGLSDILIVVVRYFGGIKLGAGGLVGAYSKSVSDALDNADTARFDYAKFYLVKCDYSDFRKISDEIAKTAQTVHTEYADSVEIKFACSESEADSLTEKLTDLSSGKAIITYTGEGFFGFDK